MSVGTIKIVVFFLYIFLFYCHVYAIAANCSCSCDCYFLFFWLWFLGIRTKCRLAQQDIDFLLDPILVVGRIGVGALLIDQAANIDKRIDKIKQLTDVIGDGGCVWITPLQMLLIDLTNALHALINALIVAICSRLWTCSRLH